MTSSSLIAFSELAVGAQARIRAYQPGHGPYRKRLLAMGLTPNTLVRLLRRAPLGDPIQIQLRGFSMSLRRAEASILLVEREEDSG